MRWNESEKAEDKPLKSKKKEGEREIPLSKPGETDYEQLSATKNRPLLGGNSFG